MSKTHEEKYCKVGYGIRRKYQRLGYVEKALTFASSQLFSRTELFKIVASVDPQNIPSIKLLEKCKFKFEGINAGVSFNKRTGLYEDRAIYCKKREGKSLLRSHNP